MVNPSTQILRTEESNTSPSFQRIKLEIIIRSTSVFWLQANNGRLKPIDQSAIPNIIRQRQLER